MGLLALETVIMTVAFAMGIALKAKDQSVVENIGNVDSSLLPFAVEPDLVDYNLFCGVVGFVSVLAMLVITYISEIIYVSLFILVHFLNFVFFLASFIQFQTSDMTSSANCDALDGTSLKAAFCSLPKACEGIAVVAWVLSLAVLGVRWWASHELPAGHAARIALYPDNNPSLERKAIRNRAMREKAETSPA